MDAPFDPRAVIARKRDGLELSRADIERFVAAVAGDELGDGPIAAFAMAVYLRGLSVAERVALTAAMTASGEVLHFCEFAAPKLDKHSTGGVGDKVSLVLAPLLAACGGCVPMISGRGLGHTGGTLDKLDSIPGYRSRADRAAIRAALRAAGCAIVGQTETLAPADRRLYAVRDVTATVESVDLIVASILSKKLAAGLDALVLDVKAGNGAFMATPADAFALADALCEVANGAGLRTSALVSDMNQVLGDSAGNALEVREAVDFLTGVRRDPRLLQLTLALGGELLTAAGLAADPDGAAARLRRALDDGSAAARFEAMVVALGGPNDILRAADKRLPAAPVRRALRADRAGVVHAVDVRAVGETVVALGGGRRRADDSIDHAVGIDRAVGVGVEIAAGDPLALVHARSEADADAAETALRAAFTLADTPAPPRPLLYSRTDRAR